VIHAFPADRSIPTSRSNGEYMGLQTPILFCKSRISLWIHKISWCKNLISYCLFKIMHCLFRIMHRLFRIMHRLFGFSQ
jgi:hypothetical protein